MYRNYIFDLYGTLVDIHTDEEKDELWTKMAELYGREGAAYTQEALKKAYRDGCRKEEERLWKEIGTGKVGIKEIGTGKIGIKKIGIKKIGIKKSGIEIEIGRVFSDLFLQKGVTAKEEFISDLAYRFRKLSREYIRLYEGTEPLLQRLREEGKHIYLLSNAQRLFTAPEIEEMGIEKYFDDIFISSDFGIKKPEKAYMEALLQKHGLKKEECLMIGNEKECDIAVAERCGVDGLLIADGDFSGI